MKTLLKLTPGHWNEAKKKGEYEGHSIQYEM